MTTMTGGPVEVQITPASDAVVFEAPLRFATEADWTAFLGSWTGVCENTGAPLPAEGRDYKMKGPEG